METMPTSLELMLVLALESSASGMRWPSTEIEIHSGLVNEIADVEEFAHAAAARVASSMGSLVSRPCRRRPVRSRPSVAVPGWPWCRCWSCWCSSFAGQVPGFRRGGASLGQGTLVSLPGGCVPRCGIRSQCEGMRASTCPVSRVMHDMGEQ